jgi:4-hydroxy-4-methyl-2-oxoglutarate aldolase
MKIKLSVGVASVLALLAVAGWLSGQQSGGSVIDSFKTVEVASVADGIEQLYGTKNYMWHDMRPLFKTKFVGPAVTVYLRKEEHKEGSAGTQAMIDAIDTAPAGSVYVIVVEDGLNYGALGGLMGTTLKYRGVAGAIVDASIRDLPQLQRLQFPIYSRGVSPGTTVNHYRATHNVPVTCAGVKVNPGDLISADEDGVVVIPKERASEILAKSQQLDYTEHATFPFIEQTKSLAEAVKKFGRL